MALENQEEIAFYIDLDSWAIGSRSACISNVGDNWSSSSEDIGSLADNFIFEYKQMGHRRYQ